MGEAKVEAKTRETVGNLKLNRKTPLVLFRGMQYSDFQVSSRLSMMGYHAE